MAGANQSKREQRNAAELKAKRLQPCRRCGQDIDYDAEQFDPNGFNAGHIKPRALYPHLAEDPSNLQPEHARCNQSAQLKTSLALGHTSTDW